MVDLQLFCFEDEFEQSEHVAKHEMCHFVIVKSLKQSYHQLTH